MQPTLASLFLLLACFLFSANGQTGGVPLGDRRIPYLNPVTGNAASCTSYVFAAPEHQPRSSQCISDAEVFLSFTDPGAFAFCSGLSSLLQGRALDASVVISNTSSRSTMWCETEMIGNFSHVFGAKFCNLAYQILFKITAFELRSPSLQIIFTDEQGVEHIRSEEFTVSLLCPQVLSPDFTPVDKFYSVPRVHVITTSGWSDAFVPASVLARKSQYTSDFLKIHAASYYEVFWTYKNNIAGGISAHVSTTTAPLTTQCNTSPWHLERRGLGWRIDEIGWFRVLRLRTNP